MAFNPENGPDRHLIGSPIYKYILLFRAQLPELLKTHKGEYVVYARDNPNPVGFFKSSREAYGVLVSEYGLGEGITHLVASPENKPVIKLPFWAGAPSTLDNYIMGCLKEKEN